MSLDYTALAAEVHWTLDMPFQKVYCRCGADERRDNVCLLDPPVRALVSREPCPSCGSHGPLWAVFGDDPRSFAVHATRI